MTENELQENMELYKNPDLLPLEDLKLKIQIEGVTKTINALNKRWASNRYFLHYEAPIIYDDDGSEIVGAKEHWINIVNYIINDLRWLLSLPFYRFWSNIVYNTSVMDVLVSFLQEAPPFYALENFPNCSEMLKLLETLHRYVLMIFARLVTNKESPEEYMSRPFLGNLLYENYIFTVPIILDLCQLYGRENDKIIGKILNCLFTLEPRYNNDLQKAVPCFIEALENVERKFGNSSIEHINEEAVSLSKRNSHSSKLTLFNLEDMTLYVLDISSTINVFLKNYPPAVGIFHTKDFMNKIVSIYGSTIPEMYKTLDKLAYNEENMPKYVELKLRLDVTRIELLNLYRVIIYEPILNIQENLNTITDAEIKERVDEYFNLLNDVIIEKEFITDYDRVYPVQSDLKALLNICPEFDEMYKYTLDSVNLVIGKSATSSVTFSNSVNEAVAGPSGISKQAITSSNTNSSNEKRMSMKKDSVEIITLVSEVKDILCDLDERFIEMCLDYYDYDAASVINAVLEDSLPLNLKELKDLRSSMNNSIPVYDDTMINDDLTSDIEDLRVFDNYDDDDDDDDNIEVPKEYITRHYSLVLDDYEDEYDDTYDNRDIRGNAQDDSVEIDSRPFTTPRVLLGKKKVETIDESESEDEETTVENGKDRFIQNPEEIRAKAEQRRQAMRGGKTAFNVTGKPKGRGQEKDVLYNRHQKNTHKSTRANHNRRSGAQWKRNQGIIPS